MEESEAPKNAATSENQETTVNQTSTPPPPQYQDPRRVAPRSQQVIPGVPRPYYTTVFQGYGYNANTQQLVPVMSTVPAYRPSSSSLEPAEAAVARPLSVIALFCCLQLWFAIPAMILAFRRNKSKSIYNISIALSVAAICLGMIGALIMMIFGMIMPFRIFYIGNSADYGHNNVYHDNYYTEATSEPTTTSNTRPVVVPTVTPS